MKPFSLLLFLLGTTLHLSAQVDSLTMCLDTAQTKEVRYQILDQICNVYYETNEYDSLKYYASIYLIELGEGELKTQKRLYKYLITCAETTNNLSEILLLTEKYEMLCEQVPKDDYGLYQVWRSRYLFYLRTDSISIAYKCLQTAMEYAKRTNNKGNLMGIHGDYALLYSEYLNDDKQALIHAQKVFYFSEFQNPKEAKRNNIANQFVALSNLGVAHKNIGQLDSALYYYRKMEDLISKHSILAHPFYLAVCKSHVSEVLLLEGDIKRAVTSAKSAVAAAKESGVVNAIGVSLLNLADGQKQNGNLELAKNTALEVSSNSLTSKDKARLYKLLADIEEEFKLSNNALSYYKSYNAVKDSLHETKSKNNFIRQEVAFQFELERRELEYQQSLKENQLKQQRLGLGLLGILFILSGILAASIYRNYRRQRATNKILIETQTSLQKSNHRLNRFARSISHDIMGQLEHILLSSKLVDEAQLLSTASKNYYTESINSARSLRDYCYELLTWSKQDSSLTEQEEISLESIVEEVLSIFKQQLEEDNFDIQINTLPKVQIPKAVLQQVMHNLVSNAIKNTKHRDRPLLKIEGKLEDHGWVIAVEDNGKGVPTEERLSIFQGTANPEEKHGRGLSYVKDVLQEYEGSIWVDNNQLGGASFYFTVR